jgi:hypothetical protein
MGTDKEYSETAKKIMMGFNKAIEKLIIKTAKEDGELVCSENRKIKFVKVKELLKQMKDNTR